MPELLKYKAFNQVVNKQDMASQKVPHTFPMVDHPGHVLSTSSKSDVNSALDHVH